MQVILTVKKLGNYLVKIVNNMKTKAYRHGEIAFEVIEKLPENLKETKDKEFKKGSHGNSHSFDNGVFYPKKENQFIIGYFEAKNTTLLHSEHGEKSNKKLKEANLPDGIYCVRQAVEFINGEMKQVID